MIKKVKNTKNNILQNQFIKSIFIVLWHYLLLKQ